MYAEAAKRNNEFQEEPAPKIKQCIHCGGDHDLSTCDLLSNTELLDIMSQLKLVDKQQQGGEGNMLFQGEKQDKKSGLKRNYLYLNTCTTEDQMVNPSYLTKIHKASKPLTLHTNAGSINTTLKGYLGSELF